LISRYGIWVDRRLARQVEHLLTDDVVLDLVGATGDRLRRHRQQDLGDHAVEDAVGVVQLAVGAGEVRVGARRRLGDAAGRQLAERALRAGGPAGGAGGLGAAGRPLMGPPQGDEAGHVLAGDRVVGAALQLGDLLHEVGSPGPLRVPGVGLEVLLGFGRRLLGGAPGGLGRRAGPHRRELALERERRHGDAPAIAG
jgi:hypothetical protein